MDFVLSALHFGFHVGFNSSSVSLRSVVGNMPSALSQPAVINDYLRNKLLRGPYQSPLLVNLHVSRLGIIPKNCQLGKWRLILDLSSPLGGSINDRIPKEAFSVQYLKIDSIIDGIMSYGNSVLMAKFDVESTYRNVVIHSVDCSQSLLSWSNCLVGN